MTVYGMTFLRDDRKNILAAPKKNKKPNALSVGEETFALQLRALKLDAVRQFKFCDTRDWLFDFAHTPSRVVLDIQGGVWIRGAHARGAGITNDCEKYSTATTLGYKVLLATTEQVLRGDAMRWWFSATKELDHGR